MNRKIPTIIKKTVIAETRQFCIETLDLKFSSGQFRQYERLTRNTSMGAVLIVPMLNQHTVLLVREYAAGLHKYELGLPKGKIDAGEDALTAANRELKEEVGYGAKKLRKLHTVSLAPAYLEHTIDIILAEDLDGFIFIAHLTWFRLVLLGPFVPSTIPRRARLDRGASRFHWRPGIRPRERRAETRSPSGDKPSHRRKADAWSAASRR